MAYADLDDLRERFPRDLTEAEEARAGTLLDDASFWLGVWVSGLAGAVDTSEQVAQAAKLLVVAMVKRALLAAVVADPAVESISESAGPFNRSIKYRNPEGNLFLYGSELAALEGLLAPSAVSMRSPGL